MYLSTAPEEPSPSEGLPGHVQDLLGRRLEALILQADAVDPDPRLGLVLPRLKAALLDAEADDMVQATLMRAGEHRSQFKDGTNLIAWLYTILRNTHLNQRKRLRRAVEAAGILEGRRARPRREFREPGGMSYAVSHSNIAIACA